MQKGYTESKEPRVSKTKNGKIMLLFRCAVCGNKTFKFMKEQEGVRTPLSKILDDILF